MKFAMLTWAPVGRLCPTCHAMLDPERDRKCPQCGREYGT